MGFTWILPNSRKQKTSKLVATSDILDLDFCKKSPVECTEKKQFSNCNKYLEGRLRYLKYLPWVDGLAVGIYPSTC